MSGYIHIIRLSRRTGTHDVTITQYQLNYVESGTNYAISWDEERLIEFLRDRVPLSELETAQVLDELHNTGQATIGDVDIAGSEAASMGMQMINED
jgi:hypothetical protein